MRLNRYLTEAASSGVQMEHAITDIWNGKPFPSIVKDARITDEGVNRIVSALKGKVNGKAQVFGATSVDVTDRWKRFFPGGKVAWQTKTPKTDIIIGNNNISLKSGPEAQLMSGQKSETLATFLNVAEELNLDGVADAIASKLENIMMKGTIESGEAVGTAKFKDELLMKADKAQQGASKVISDFFNNNQEFKIAFAREAMSGKLKFGEGSPAAADWFLNVAWDGKKVNYHSVNDAAYVSHIANKMKPVVNFKSARPPWKSGERDWATVLRLQVNKLTEEIEQYEGQILTEGILKRVKDKIVNWAKDLSKKVRDFISKSWANLFSFLGITPDVKVNNIVKL
jgi:hypothetical protein